MKILRNIIFIIISILIIIFLTPVFPFITDKNGLFIPNQNKIERALARDFTSLEYVAECFMNTSGDYVKWHTNDNVIEHFYFNYNENDFEEKIGEDTLGKCINYLDDKNYSQIIKKDNYISFVYWSDFGSSVSIVFSPHGAPQIKADEDDILCEVNQLSKPNWYYYKHIDNR